MATTALSLHHPYWAAGLSPWAENLQPCEGTVILKGPTLHPLSQITFLKISYYLHGFMITRRG